MVQNDSEVSPFPLELLPHYHSALLSLKSKLQVGVNNPRNLFTSDLKGQGISGFFSLTSHDIVVSSSITDLVILGYSEQEKKLKNLFVHELAHLYFQQTSCPQILDYLTKISDEEEGLAIIGSIHEAFAYWAGSQVSSSSKFKIEKISKKMLDLDYSINPGVMNSLYHRLCEISDFYGPKFVATNMPFIVEEELPQIQKRK